ncbi:signal recognition particle-docking protein FtsY [Abyssibacter profundi]|uniref:Signal recognition particle receptor FtsY n=1 Tax=Abyssibacter profundi TaxID=2182787 RepID=A0A363ULT4_9GAMM|nr:signal recognition particle-docking protein FtsY [Abyssibacter profundi]MBV62522.1 signal recognition particle-docking protein FtsY [Nevskiales bacterium]PWN56390.1 signal recognition particle-docking protein FtsY [Abyssibacter profundi]
MSADNGGGFVTRLRAKLNKGDSWLTYDLANLLPGQGLDDDALEELETRLLTSDVGVEATMAIVDHLRAEANAGRIRNAEALRKAIANVMGGLLEPVSQPLDIPEFIRPYIILMVGVNGAGKTTTIGKLARRLQQEGKSVMLAAGDTFRAAAVEQLKTWGQRNNVPVIAQGQNADSASVIFDAVQAAKGRGIDVIIADTAGRLHTQGHLMEELRKIKRVVQKHDAYAPHEVMLVVDATTGNNALNQAVQFHEAVGLTGITVTKLDGTARGGIVFAIAKRLGLPIRFVGVGESAEDLGEFNAQSFINALFEPAA